MTHASTPTPPMTADLLRRHWVMEFKTAGQLPGDDFDPLVELTVLRIDPHQDHCPVLQGPIQFLFYPGRAMTSHAVTANGFSNQRLEDAASFDQQANSLVRILENSTVYTRNAGAWIRSMKGQFDRSDWTRHFDDLNLTVVDLKRQASLLNVSQSARFLDVFHALGIEVNEHDKNGLTKVENLRQAVVKLRALEKDRQTPEQPKKDTVQVQQPLLPETEEQVANPREFPITFMDDAPSEKMANVGGVWPNEPKVDTEGMRVVSVRHLMPYEREKVPQALQGERSRPLVLVHSRTGNKVLHPNRRVVKAFKLIAENDKARELADRMVRVLEVSYHLLGYDVLPYCQTDSGLSAILKPQEPVVALFEVVIEVLPGLPEKREKRLKALAELRAVLGHAIARATSQDALGALNALLHRLDAASHGLTHYSVPKRNLHRRLTVPMVSAWPKQGVLLASDLFVDAPILEHAFDGDGVEAAHPTPAVHVPNAQVLNESVGSNAVEAPLESVQTPAILHPPSSPKPAPMAWPADRVHQRSAESVLKSIDGLLPSVDLPAVKAKGLVQRLASAEGLFHRTFLQMAAQRCENVDTVKDLFAVADLAEELAVQLMALSKVRREEATTLQTAAVLREID